MTNPPVQDPGLMAALMRDADQAAAAQEEAATEAVQKDPTITEAAEELAQCMEREAQLTAELEAVKDRKEQLRTSIIPGLMQKHGMVRNNKGSFTFSGGRVQLQTRVFASQYVKGERAELFRQWCEANAPDLLEARVGKDELAAFVKERREKGLSDPPGISIFERTVAQLVRST